MNFLNKIYAKIRGNFTERAKIPLSSLHKLLGFYPLDIRYYKAAFTHNSCSYIGADGRQINNERLEFLGDSVLATVMSAYLYKRYPDWNEGQMSKRRSALVKRAMNNAAAERLNLSAFIQKKQGMTAKNDILGNTLEALLGAIYLDRGYNRAEEFIMEKLIPIFSDIERDEVNLTINYKSTLIEWSQKHHLNLEFNTIQEPKFPGGNFVSEVWIDGNMLGKGKGHTKKESHQDASHKAILKLEIRCPDLKDIKKSVNTDRAI